MIASSSVDGAGCSGAPLRVVLSAPGRSALSRSKSSYVFAAYALVRRSSYSVIGRRPAAAASARSCATCTRSVSAAGSDLLPDAGVLIATEPTAKVRRSTGKSRSCNQVLGEADLSDGIRRYEIRSGLETGDDATGHWQRD